MKKSTVWIGISVTLLTALANGSTNGEKEQNFKLVQMHDNDQNKTAAIQVWLNADGSAHFIDTYGNVTFVDQKILELIKKFNFIGEARLQGGTDCFGKSSK